jgi:hypothetical protein
MLAGIESAHGHGACCADRQQRCRPAGNDGRAAGLCAVTENHRQADRGQRET